VRQFIEPDTCPVEAQTDSLPYPDIELITNTLERSGSIDRLDVG
jgi:hypothetical protein